MSFEVLSKAVEIFSDGFYKALILKSMHFEEAAGHGRSALYQNPNRYTRVQLSDFMIVHTWAPYAQMRDKTARTCGLGFGIRLVSRTLCEFGLWCLPHLDRLFNRPRGLPSRLPDLVHKYTPIFPALQSLGLNIGKIQYHQVLKMDIRIMHLEDRLKQAKALYIWGPRRVDNAKFIRQLADIWLLTNFVDSVHRVNACQFRETSLQTFFRELWSSIWGNKRVSRRSPRCSRTKKYHADTRRQLFIIEDVDQLSEEYITEPALREDAADRLKAFYEKLPLESSYRIIIGKDEDWMNNQDWGDGTEEFHHNRPFPAFTKYEI
jgi:hypothetical protein